VKETVQAQPEAHTRFIFGIVKRNILGIIATTDSLLKKLGLRPDRAEAMVQGMFRHVGAVVLGDA
jgi:hypothetical protein